MRSLLRLLLPGVLALSPLAAAVRVPSILGSHMVLQQRSSVPVWGWANAAETVVVTTSWSTNIVQATVSNGGRWSVNIQTPEAGGPHSIRIKAGNEIVLEDVLIGEVWLCSGQSNMEWSGELGVRQSREEAPGATNNLIRFFHVPKATAEAPQDHVDGHWVVCNPGDMQRFSAIGYFFGKRIHERLNAPVGLINSSWGGTPAEVWTPREVVEAAPDLRAAAAELKPYAWWPHQPGLAYNAMIHPLLPFRIAGVLWYQGESNVPTHATYRKLFTYMIDAWRAAWKSELPVYFVQIAPYTYGDDHIRGALLREAQTLAANHPRTGMAVISDLVDNVKDIHPQMKREVAERLAAMALADTYGIAGPQSRSPSYRGHRIEGNTVIVDLDPIPTTLVARGGPPTEFQIAGADGKFVPAEAVIDGKTVRVSSASVAQPTAVRFGFRNDSIPNLFTAEGLPVNLFRTDR
jgi:sialate O-acetylesterase